jgi:hypothetical protein
MDTEDVIRRAEEALARAAKPIAGGWGQSATKRSVYKGAEFKVGEESWVACRGPQRPALARLLDATAWMKSERSAHGAVAILCKPDIPTAKREYPVPPGFADRHARAAWVGCGILVVVTDDANPPKVLDPLPRDGLPDLRDLADRAIQRHMAAEPASWRGIRRSRMAEEHVRSALRSLGEMRPGREGRFRAHHRNAETDGILERSVAPMRVALEVKVDEDLEAPVGQILDDLGAFDAVLCVRVLRSHATRERYEKLKALRDSMAARLPVVFLDYDVSA